MSILTGERTAVNMVCRLFLAIVMVMHATLLMIALASMASLLLWTKSLWQYRNIAAWVGIVLDGFIGGVFLFTQHGVLSFLFAGVLIYKLCNYARLLRNQMQPEHLYRVSLRTALVLSLTQIVLVLCALPNSQDATWPLPGLYLVVAVQVIVSAILVSSTQRHLQTTKTLQAVKNYADASLPSISVLIPARNETNDLKACLDALVASNYPKLEIIVLDDCSQDKRTPEIIKSFAHAGVRFIAGQAPGNNWLAKNFAYQQLVDAASGDYLVFCGVDLQVSVTALRELITTMLEKEKLMLSVLPKNSKPQDLRTYLIQPARYMWELSLPRRLFNRPPVLSTCWIIAREALLSAGSFKATSRSISPESYFARSTARRDGYSFVRSNLLISTKPAAEQQATAVRTRYPQLHRRPELAALLTAIELCSFVLPLPLAITAFVMGWWIVGAAATVAYLLFYVVYLQVTGVMYGRVAVEGIVLLPFLALYDLYLLHLSLYGYEFGEIHWKDRNVCLPVMRFDESVTTATSLPNRG